MRSSNRNSTLNFDTQPGNRPRLVGALPIYFRQNEAEGNFLENVPRKRRSTSIHNKPKSTSTIAKCCIITNGGGSKEIPTVTKILIGACFAAILTPQVTTHSTSAKLEMIFEWVAILSMMVGLYIQGQRPKLSMWLQRFGHLNCLVGLMLIQGTMLQFPVTYIWIPPFAVALILGAAMFFQA